MAVVFENSRTKENLMKAFAGESQARNRYTIAAEKAVEQHLYAISRIFLFTAEQERAHGQRFYELLKPAEGETIQITGTFPVDTYDSVTDLLRTAEHNETAEYETVYRTFGDQAKEEGFLEEAAAFYQIADIERIHARRFQTIRKLLESNLFYEQIQEGVWMCLNCGHIHRGMKAPQICPVCRHEQGYFIPLNLAPYTDAAMVTIQA